MPKSNNYRYRIKLDYSSVSNRTRLYIGILYRYRSRPFIGIVSNSNIDGYRIELDYLSVSYRIEIDSRSISDIQHCSAYYTPGSQFRAGHWLTPSVAILPSSKSISILNISSIPSLLSTLYSRNAFIDSGFPYYNMASFLGVRKDGKLMANILAMSIRRQPVHAVLAPSPKIHRTVLSLNIGGSPNTAQHTHPLSPEKRLMAVYVKVCS